MAASVMPDASGTSSWIADRDTSGPPLSADLVTLCTELDEVLTAEVHGAATAMGCTAEDLLVAALARAIARAIGEGILVIDIATDRERAGFRRVGLPCVSRRGLSGPELLAATHTGADRTDHRAADVGFSYCASTVVAAGYPLSMHVEPDTEATMVLQWCFDTRGFDRYTVDELAEQFPLALIEVCSG